MKKGDIMNDFSQNYKSLINDYTSEITLLSNTSAFLNMFMENISWVGFYLYQNNELILGPFQGNVACTNIKLDKGVCGDSARTKACIIVSDVHKYANHIACDSASNSEIVLPIIVNGELYGVLDVDSTQFDRFHKEDQEVLESCIRILVDKLIEIKNIV